MIPPVRYTSNQTFFQWSHFDMKERGIKEACPIGLSTARCALILTMVMAFALPGTASAVTYNMRASTGSSLNGFTTNYGTCGTNATTEVIVPMNTTSGANQCTTGRTGSTAASGTSILLVVSEAVYAQAMNITGIDVTGNLRDYQEATNPGTLAGIQYQLGYVIGGAFTSFGSANEARDWSTQTNYTTNLSGISGTAPLNSRLALRVFKQNPNATEYRFYFTAASLVLNVTETAASTGPGSLQLGSPVYSVNENGGAVSVSVTRTGGSTGAVGVSYSTANGTATSGTDYTTASGSLSWAAGDAADKTISVLVTNDTTTEGSETFTVNLSGPTGGATLGSPVSATVTILDDESAPPPPATKSPAGGPLVFGLLSFGMLVYGVIRNRRAVK
jgi:Calx-beta domain-containing protein